MPLHDPLDVVAQLGDERSRRVILVSHCLLNENTRYAGGAFHPGAVDELVAQLIRSGCGIYQMPCPEQRAWGGVLKRHLLRACDSQGTPLYRFRRPLLWAFIAYTRIVYAALASRVARDVADYDRSQFEVVGIIGVSASPSCGVSTTLDLHRSFDVLASCPLAQMNRSVMNECVVMGCRVAGEGLFIRSLQRALRRRGLVIRLLEHDLVAEMQGERQAPLRLTDRGDFHIPVRQPVISIQTGTLPGMAHGQELQGPDQAQPSSRS